jgi:hypothetical protein
MPPSIRDQFGAGNTSGGGLQYKNFKLKEIAEKGIGVRILPAMKSLRERGVCSAYHAQHFGYSGTNPRDPQKRVPRPFACVEEKDRRTQMVTKACPECENQKIHTRIRDEAAAKVREACKRTGMLDEKLINARIKDDEVVKRENQWLRDHNLSKHYYMAVYTTTGELGILPIGYKAKQSLDGEVAKLRKRGAAYEPISNLDGGYFFTFDMSNPGEQNNVTTASVMTEDAGDGLMRLKPAPLSDEVLEKAIKVLPDLADAGIRRLSETQIKLLVDGSGDPEEVDTIMKMGTGGGGFDDVQDDLAAGGAPASETTGGESSRAAPPPPQRAAQQPPKPAAEVAAPQPQAVAAAAYDDEEAKLEAQLNAMRAAKAKKAAEAAAPTVSADKSKLDPMDPTMTPEQFLQEWGEPPPR